MFKKGLRTCYLIVLLLLCGAVPVYGNNVQLTLSSKHTMIGDDTNWYPLIEGESLDQQLQQPALKNLMGSLVVL